MTKPFCYRPEIDGLRAIAILLVLFFHADLGLPGGYIGVDIFFVISGYVITHSILNKIENGSFSVLAFWGNRIKRLIPALTAVLLFTFLVGPFVLTRLWLKDMTNCSIMSLLFSSNIYFWKLSGGYFSPMTELKPLLHTWSLSLEEQFYLTIPFLFLIKKRISLKAFIIIISVLALSSLTCCLLVSKDHIAFSFYNLPSRAWEIFMGILLALIPIPIIKKRRIADFISGVSLTTLIGFSVLIHDKTPFPGLVTIPIILATMAVIYSSATPQSLCQRALSLKPMAFLGIISYSLYLWHWPILTFSKHIWVDPLSILAKIGLILLSILFAILSWRYIEKPFRSKKTSGHIAKPFIGLCSILLLFAGLSLLIRQFPYVNFYTETRISSEAAVHYTGTQYASTNGPKHIGNTESKGSDDFILWGDSHGLACCKAIDELAKKKSLAGKTYLYSGTLPIPIAHNNKKTEQAFREILTSGPKHLIIISAWSGHFNSTQTASRADLQSHLQEMINQCAAKNIHVYIIRQVPKQHREFAANDFCTIQRFPNLNKDVKRYTVSYTEHLEYTDKASQIFSQIESDNFTLIDPSDAFFSNPKKRLEWFSSESHYYDEDHLTHFGATKFILPHIESIFKKL